ncbi:MAG: LysR substrate-binding domain-containing protein [Pseudaminobacter sp.]
MLFDISLLRSFETVYQLSSFTKAAAQLNLTQSAISAHIKRLEEQADCVLFERNTRSVTLTPHGQALLGYARAILRLSEDARAHLRGRGDATHLRIGASDDLTSTWLPGALRKFQDLRLGKTLELHISNTASLLESMEQGEVDLVLGCRCRGDESGRTLWSEPLVWAFARNALPDELAPLPLAVFPEPCPYRDAALAALASADRAWRIATVSPSLGSLTAVAEAGLAVTPLNACSLSPGLNAVGADARLPGLPDIDFVAHIRPNLPSDITALSEAIIIWIMDKRPLPASPRNMQPNRRSSGRT